MPPPRLRVTLSNFPWRIANQNTMRSSKRKPTIEQLNTAGMCNSKLVAVCHSKAPHPHRMERPGGHLGGDSVSTPPPKKVRDAPTMTLSHLKQISPGRVIKTQFWEKMPTHN